LSAYGTRFTLISGKHEVAYMKAGKCNNNSGLTLLEVLISMVIMSISLLILLNMAMVALHGNDWSNKTTIATQVMQEKLEQLRSEISPASGSDTTSGVVRQWTVSNAGSYLRKVDITVTWKDISSKVKTNSLVSYIKTDSL
jgi:type II secretion system protein I